MFGLTFSQWTDLIQAVGLAGASLGAALVFWKSRKGQVSVGLEPRCRIHLSKDGPAILLVSIRLRNTSNILFRYTSAAATLLDASQRADGGGIRLIPFAEEDPFLPLNSDISEDSVDLLSGRTFRSDVADTLSLEPGEYADGEVAFVLSDQPAALLAMRVMVEGRQGRWGRRPYWWATFFYIDPSSLVRGGGPFPGEGRSSRIETA